MKLKFSPFPILKSERLVLRQIVESDLHEVFELRSDPETIKYIPRPEAQSLQYAMNHIEQVNEGVKKNKSINWAITLKGEDKLIGLIGFVRIQPRNFRAEVGYVLHPDYRGKGVMTEALKAVLTYGFVDLKFHSVIAVIDPSNNSSEKLLLRQGFCKEAHLKENVFFNDRFLDTVIYSLLKRNYKYI